MCADYAIAFQDHESVVLGSELEKYFGPTPAMETLDQRKIALGRALFHEPALSSNGAVSCSSCHNVASGGGDGRAVSTGVSGRPLSRNSPSIIYAGEHQSQFWDGRSATLAEQIEGPIHNPDEMNSNWDHIEAKLKKIPNYVSQFRSIYSRPPNRNDIKDAIVTFERSLGNYNSKFDRFLRGDNMALGEEQQQGASMFVSFGCASCHHGPLLGGTMYHKLGVVHEYFGGGQSGHDTGRFNITNRERDKFYFKVPSLRNVAQTAPYLHDGTIDSLETIVDTMAFHQLGRRLSRSENNKIVEFLKSLSDEGDEIKTVASK